MDWVPLKPGDTIEVVAPASKCSIEELNAGKKYLESLGYQVDLPKDLFSDDPFHANSDKQRINLFLKALRNPKSKAIWCARGGYGSQRLLPQLRKIEKPKIYKPLIGLSDITSLHVFFNEAWNRNTLHAPILSRIGKGDLPSESVKELFAVLSGESEKVNFQELIPLNKKAEKKSVLKGKIIGGNLATLCSHLGTPWAPRFKNGILFLEDVSERGYKIDRLLFQLSHQPHFKNLKAVVLGDFTEGEEPDGRDLGPIAIQRWSESLDIPVLKGLPVGHGKIQRVLPMGTSSELKTGKVGSLVIKSGFSSKGLG